MEKLTVKNIFAYNMIHAPTCHLDKNYSYLHSLLLHIENQFSYNEMHVETFSKSVLQALNLTSAFFPVDRVCLALTYPNGRRIQAISTVNSTRAGTNLMNSNYSCFVGKKSSILKTETSNVRIYSDIDQIMRRYPEGVPVQRSLRLLNEMGIKSGVTIPLPVSDSLAGILFINSVYPGTFDKLEPEDYSTLCLLKLIATSLLNKAFSNTMGFDSHLASSLLGLEETSNFFSETECKQLLENLFSKRFDRKIAVIVKNHAKDAFLFALKPSLFAMAKALESCGYIFKSDSLEIEVNLTTTSDGDFVEFKIKGPTPTQEQIKFLKNLELYFGQTLLLREGSLILRSPCEICKNKLIDYSV